MFSGIAERIPVGVDSPRNIFVPKTCLKSTRAANNGLLSCMSDISGDNFESFSVQCHHVDIETEKNALQTILEKREQINQAGLLQE